uniref:Cadherin-5 n=1 Tax=Cyprinus carpio TaxID=7962 RepID=A0A8C2J8E9_CYPCA
AFLENTFFTKSSRFILSGEGANDMFTVNEYGDISVNAMLDREKKSVYKLSASLIDSMSRKPLDKDDTFEVVVLDINDNSPVFPPDLSGSISESSKAGAIVMTVNATDADDGSTPNGRIEYKLLNGTDLFNINNESVIRTLKSSLDREKQSQYIIAIKAKDMPGMENGNSATTTVTININDVNDNIATFKKGKYQFNVKEDSKLGTEIGLSSAGRVLGYLFAVLFYIKLVFSCRRTRHSVDIDFKSSLEVTAHEDVPNGLKSYALVNLKVLDINDNAPELINGNLHVCENDIAGTIIGTVGAHDKDESSKRFRFTLAKKSSNFSLHDNENNTASIELKQGGFSTERSMKYVLEIEISDGGTPEQKSINLIQIKVCTCQTGRRIEYCRAYAQTGVSVSALLAILLCIITILVIVILIVLRRRYQKEVLIAKSSGEIHEQLVTYDEEGGGEMDTNGYDVSILSSACHDSSFRPGTGPSLYAVVKKPPACKGDMGMMIEVKKDEADHDRDGIPYDTLHIYGYEGSESLAGSLSSLDSSSSGSNLDYDFLHEWGPRFRTLAQLYGVDGSDTDSSD